MSFQYPLPLQILISFIPTQNPYTSLQQCHEVVILDVCSTHSHAGTSVSRNSMSTSSIESKFVELRFGATSPRASVLN